MYFKAAGFSFVISSEALKVVGEDSKLPAWIRCVPWRALPTANCQADSERASATGVQVKGLVVIEKLVYG